MPVPFALLAAAIPGALQVGEALINKPKEKDFTPNTAGMEKYLAYLKGKTASNEVAHMAMQPALKAIGSAGRKTEREVDYAVGRGDLSGSEEAQLRLSQGQQQTSALQEAGETAFAAQQVENRRTGEKVAEIVANIEQAKEQATLDYERATQDYKKQLAGGALNIAGSVATAGISDFMTKQATSQSAFDAAKVAGIGDFETVGDLAEASKAAGFTDSGQYVNMLGQRENIVSSLSQYSEDEISAVMGGDVMGGIRAGTIGREELDFLQKGLGEGRTNLIMDTYKGIGEGKVGIEDIKKLDLPDPVKIQMANTIQTYKTSMATDAQKDIAQLAFASDKKGLLEYAARDDIKASDLKAIMGNYSSIVKAENKQMAANIKASAKAAGISPGKASKMANFAGDVGTLVSTIEQLNVSLENTKGTALIEAIGRIRDRTSISNTEQDGLNKLVRDYVKSLGWGKNKVGDLPNFAWDNLAGGLSKTALAEKTLSSQLTRIIESLRSNSVELTEAQRVGMTGNSLGLTPPG